MSPAYHPASDRNEATAARNARAAAANLVAHEYDLALPDINLPAGGYEPGNFIKPVLHFYHSFDCACFFSFRSSI